MRNIVTPIVSRATLKLPRARATFVSPSHPVAMLHYRARMPNLPPELASKRPSPEALRCPSGQGGVTKKRRSIYKELNGKVVRDMGENCPCKNRVTVETATTTAMGGPPTALLQHSSSPEMANTRPPSDALRCRTRQSIAPAAAENPPSSPTDDPHTWDMRDVGVSGGPCARALFGAPTARLTVKLGG